MARNIDKIMDISSFTSSRGFIVSSSDEEDNAHEINKSSTAVGSRLQNLFGIAQPTKPAQEPQKSKNDPIFAGSAILFTIGSSDQMESQGQVGLAVLKRNDQFFLLIYNVSKQVIANFSLASGSLSLSVQYGEGSYLSLSSSTTSLSLFFEDSKKSQLLLLTAILMLLCNIEKCDIFPGEGEPATSGCHVLVEKNFVFLEEDSLNVTERANLKWKLGSNSNSYLESVSGLGKRGIRVVRTSTGIMAILTLKKIKFSHEPETIASESETSSQVPVEPEGSHDVVPTASDMEEEVVTITEKTNDILSRIVKVGLPIMPNLKMVKKEEESETNENPPIKTEEIQSPVPLPREYSTFHKVIGTEMDRLEVRLEATVQRMIDRAVEPIHTDIQEILKNQKRILLELEKLKS